MKLKDLQPGGLFQFARANGPKIHRAGDRPGLYYTCGVFVRGVPRQLCPLVRCVRHEHGGDLREGRPDRAIKKIDLSRYPDALEWLDDPEMVCERLVVLHDMDTRLAVLRGGRAS